MKRSTHVWMSGFMVGSMLAAAYGAAGGVSHMRLPGSQFRSPFPVDATGANPSEQRRHVQSPRLRSSGADHSTQGGLAQSLAQAISRPRNAVFISRASTVGVNAPPDLNGEHFISGRTGYGVTGDGNILRTANGGGTWKVAVHAASASFSYLSWHGAVGVASGLTPNTGTPLSIPTLAVTVDNGLKWKFIHPLLPSSVSGSDQTYQMVAHPLSSRLLVLLPEPAFVGGYTKAPPILVSTDGGANFHTFTLPKGWQPTGGFAAVSGEKMALALSNSVNDEQGIAIVNVVTRTAAIHGARLPVGLYGLAYRSGILYAAGGTFPEYSTPVANAIYKINLSNPRQFTPLYVLHNVRGHNYQPIVSLRVSSSGVMYALQGGVPPGANGPGQGRLLISRDGGRAFVRSAARGSTLTVFGHKIWLLTGPNPWAYSEATPNDLYSSNEGRRFITLPWNNKALGATWAQTGSPGVVYVAVGGELWQMTDRGRKMSRVALPVSSPFSSVQYAGLGKRWALRWQDTLSRPLVRVTSNGGKAWNPVSIPPAIDTLDSASILPGGWMALVGHAMRQEFDSLYIGGDGGRQWVTVRLPFGQSSGMSVDFLSVKTGYAVSGLPLDQQWPPSPYLFRTVNGGREWTRIPLGPWSFVSANDMTSAGKTVVFSGLAGVSIHRAGVSFNELAQSRSLLVEMDANGSGVRVYNLGGHIPMSISFSTANDGAMTTADGQVYATDDGGAVWRHVQLQNQ